MNTSTNTKTERQTSPEPDCRKIESMIQAEIEFWKEIIATCPVTQSSECVERMHQALALAESRLANLH